MIAYYFPHRGNFQPETLPLDKLTHIIFSFTEVIDNEMKFANDSTGLMLKTLVVEKKKHHNLKVMVACGGWEEFFTFIMKQTVYLSPMRILFQSGIRRNMQYKPDSEASCSGLLTGMPLKTDLWMRSIKQK